MADLLNFWKTSKNNSENPQKFIKILNFHQFYSTIQQNIQQHNKALNINFLFHKKQRNRKQTKSDNAAKYTQIIAQRLNKMKAYIRED